MDIVPIKKENLETVLNIYCELVNRNESKSNEKLIDFDGENILVVIMFVIFLLYNMVRVLLNKRRRSSRTTSYIGA